MDAHRPAINEEPLIVPPNSAVDDGPEHYESDDTLMGDGDEVKAEENRRLHRYVDAIRKQSSTTRVAIYWRVEPCGWFICPGGLDHLLSWSSRRVCLTSAPTQPEKAFLIAAMTEDAAGLDIYLAWAFVRENNFDTWQWFLANLKDILGKTLNEIPLSFSSNHTDLVAPALVDQFADGQVLPDNRSMVIEQADPLTVLVNFWDNARVFRLSGNARRKTAEVEERLSGRLKGRYDEISYLLTKHGRKRIAATDRFQLRFTSCGWDERKCDGFAVVRDPGKEQQQVSTFSTYLRIRDQYGTATCTCTEEKLVEGYCRHVLSTIAKLEPLGLNATKFSPFNYHKWHRLYESDLIQMEKIHLFF